MNRIAKLFVPAVLAAGTVAAVLLVAVLMQQGTSQVAHAQGTEPTPTTKTDIGVTGTGHVSVTPDTAFANLGVDITAATLADATKQASDAMTAVIAAIKAQGVDAKDIQTTGLSVYPITNQPKEGETAKITGYRVTNSVTVKIRTIDNTGKIIDAALTAGANSVNSVYFTVGDPTDAQNQARTAAVKDAMAKAQTLATAAGVKVGKITSISDMNTVVLPYERTASFAAVPAAAGGVGPVETGSTDITANVEMHFEISQ
jgi:uncharacterized protein YggE